MNASFETGLDFQTFPETVFPESITEKVREHFSGITSNVDMFVEHFRSIPDNLLYDEKYMEKFTIEKIGLNKEGLGEIAPELKPHCGTGLYIWQNPRQFSRYMIWMLQNAQKCSSYLEIGCRWGGTFIVTCEILRRANPNFKWAIAADLIEKTPFIERYMEITKTAALKLCISRAPQHPVILSGW